MRLNIKVKKDISTQDVQKLISIELIAKVSGESREQVRRYIRITHLILELLKIVDDTIIHDKGTYLTLVITTLLKRDKRYIEEYIIDAIKNYNK